MKYDSALTPAGAVLRGHLVVSLPSLAIFGLITVIVSFLIGSFWGREIEDVLRSHHAEHFPVWTVTVPIGVIIGGIVSWLWWSVSIPLWREWARINGADEERTQRLAVWTLLVWPKGCFFEKN
jgi:hypothetical protein